MLVDSDEEKSFPILGFTYLLIEKTKPEWSTCARRRELFKFFNYIYTNPSMSMQARAFGYTPLTDSVKQKVLAVLQNITCEDESSIGLDAPEDREPGLKYGMYVAAILVLLGTLGPMILLFFVKKDETNQITLFTQVLRRSRRAIFFFIFTVCVMIGAFLATISVFFWVQVPSSKDSLVCGLRLGFTFCGLMWVLGAMASRAAQVRLHLHLHLHLPRVPHPLPQVTTIRMLGLKNKTSTPFYLTLMFLRDGLIMFVLEIVLIIVWQLVDPFHPVLHATDSINLVGEWQCQAGGLTFPVIQGVLIGLALIYGIIQVYFNWSFSTTTTSQMWLLIAFCSPSLRISSSSFFPFIRLLRLLLRLPLLLHHRFLSRYPPPNRSNRSNSSSDNTGVTVIVVAVLLNFIPGDGTQASVVSIGVLFFSAQSMLTFIIPGFANYKMLLGDDHLTRSSRTQSSSLRKMNSSTGTGTHSMRTSDQHSSTGPTGKSSTLGPVSTTATSTGHDSTGTSADPDDI